MCFMPTRHDLGYPMVGEIQVPHHAVCHTASRRLKLIICREPCAYCALNKPECFWRCQYDDICHSKSVSLQALVLAARKVYFLNIYSISFDIYIYMSCATWVKSPPCVPSKRCASWHCGFDAPVYDLRSCRSLPHTAAWIYLARSKILTGSWKQHDLGSKSGQRKEGRAKWHWTLRIMRPMNRHEQTWTEMNKNEQKWTKMNRHFEWLWMISNCYLVKHTWKSVT